MDVAALFVDERGIYPTFAGIDCWGMTRDARPAVNQSAHVSFNVAA